MPGSTSVPLGTVPLVLREALRVCGMSQHGPRMDGQVAASAPAGTVALTPSLVEALPQTDSYPSALGVGALSSWLLPPLAPRG